MAQTENDPRGNEKQKSAAALLLIDLINDLEFEGGEALAKRALPVIDKVAALKKRLKTAGVPCVYVNDNFGKWQSDFKKLVDYCLTNDVNGKAIAERLQPEPDDFFVLKPRHSAFLLTPLEMLLEYFGATTVILAGIATDSCILFTAADAHMRHYRIVIPSDCVVAQTDGAHKQALELMTRVLDVKITDSDRLDTSQILAS